MIFVPSVKGLSHCFEEFTKEEHIIAGAEVLLESLLLLNEKLDVSYAKLLK
jgi:N-carbamoyl-L-amino-acid hydrolase